MLQAVQPSPCPFPRALPCSCGSEDCRIHGIKMLALRCSGLIVNMGIELLYLCVDEYTVSFIFVTNARDHFN